MIMLELTLGELLAIVATAFGILTAFTGLCVWKLQRKIQKREEVEEAREIARGAFDGGMDAELIFCFDGDSEREKIKNFIASKTGEGDIILYKASRGIRLEELT